jgi:nucleotide-binding universal stress UspA family protein
MFRSILVPLDGSTLAEQAIPIAAAIAQKNHSTVSLAIAHPWGSPEDAPRPATADDRALHEDEGLYLNRMMQSVAAAYRIPVCEALLDGAATGHTLVAYARRMSFDLIVASTHEYGFLSRLRSSGVARQLAHHTDAGVLLIKPEAPSLPVNLSGFTRILVALDGSPGAELALGPALELASAEASVFLAVVVSGNCPAPLHNQAAAQEYLAGVTRQYERAGRRLDSVVLSGANVAHAIISFAQRRGIELIALSTRPRHPLARIVFGSVADAVLHQAEVPVLVCHSVLDTAADRLDQAFPAASTDARSPA